MLERLHPGRAERCASCSRSPRRTWSRSTRSRLEHWTKLRSTNPLERVDKEIGRRADVVWISPTTRRWIRLVGALLSEQNDECAGAAPLPIGRVDGADPRRTRPVRAASGRAGGAQSPPPPEPPRRITPAKRRSFAPQPDQGRRFAARCARPCRAALDWTAAASLLGSERLRMSATWLAHGLNPAIKSPNNNKGA